VVHLGMDKMTPAQIDAEFAQSPDEGLEDMQAASAFLSRSAYQHTGFEAGAL